MKQDLKELGSILTGIGDGHEWQYCSSIPHDVWFDPAGDLDALKAIQFGYQIRLKPAPVSYAELKAACAAGKVIEENIAGTFRCGADQPAYWQEKTDGDWSMSPDRYRIKPDTVPLGPEDVPPGSVLQWPQWWGNTAWIYPVQVASFELLFVMRKGPEAVTYEALLKDGWRIKRPGQDWQLCSKPAP